MNIFARGLLQGDNSGSQINIGGKGCIRLLRPHGNLLELFQFTEEILNQMPPLVRLLVILTRRLTVTTRQDSTKPVASTDINLSIFAGAVICVSSRLNPWLFRLPNSVLSANAYRMLLSLALFITANHQQSVARRSDRWPQDSAVANTASPAPIFSLRLFSAPESGSSTPALCHLFPLSARFPCSGCSKKSRLNADTPAIHCQ